MQLLSLQGKLFKERESRALMPDDHSVLFFRKIIEQNRAVSGIANKIPRLPARA